MLDTVPDHPPRELRPLPGHRLDAAGIVVAFGEREVVHGADLRLAPGSVTALVGPNGSGKSSVLRTVARLHRAAGGAVALGEAREDAFALSRREFARRVALLTQSRPTPGGLRVEDVVAFGRHPHRRRFGGGDPEGAAAVDRALELTGVSDLRDRAVDELSGGQLQRVWLAGCLAQETGALLLDEPTTYLDLRFQVEILDLIRELADRGIAVGVVLHDLDQAAAVADRVVLLADGRVVAEGAPAEVLTADRLSAVYGIRIDVDHDPRSGRLRTRAVGRHTLRHERLIHTP